MRLDGVKLDALRSWGQGLRHAEGEELAAAGRAVLMLIEEVERLHLELQRARERLNREEHEEHDELGDPASTLQRRLHRVLRREPESLSGASPEPGEEAASPAESEEAMASPQAWIESLRQR